MKKKFKLAWILFPTIIILVILLSNFFLNKKSSLEKKAISAPIKGLGLFIENNHNNYHNITIDYNTIDDYGFKLTNNSEKDLDFKLSIFLNGKQIKLYNYDTKETNYNYEFILKSNETTKLPIKMILDSLEKGTHLLTLNFVSEYNQNAVDNDQKVWMGSNYKYSALLVNDSDYISLKDTKQINSQEDFKMIDFDNKQLIINLTNDDLINDSIPKNYIDAEKNSTVTIPIIIGGGTKGKSLVYATLDNKQIPISDNEFLIYDTPDNKAIENNVKIKVPNNPGKYDVIFYSINDLENIDVTNFTGLNMYNSHRVTLIIN